MAAPRAAFAELMAVFAPYAGDNDPEAFTEVAAPCTDSRPWIEAIACGRTFVISDSPSWYRAGSARDGEQ
ncbi:hypothetical protein [Nocardia uniformis]|uniref:hypothetical protein n=1 Tax=Nocardia uniformis TaxID=53432 RepID=UPI000829A6C7|nr:hypothetical protein [Nocardia uniformis]